MPIEILMPALSPTMTEGTLAKWVKKEGDKVESGEVIAEIETDKATMEVEAVDEGIMGKLLIAEGAEEVPVNTLIALLLEEDEDASALEGYASADAPAAAPAQAAAPAETVEENNNVVTMSAPAVSTGTGGRIFASPLAKRIAEQKGLNLNVVEGSGPHGRIVKRDVENAQPQAAGSKTASASAAFAGRNPVEATEIKLNNMRKTIAKRLQESKQTVPHFYLSLDLNLDALLAARKQLNGAAEMAAGKNGTPAYKLSVNDLIVKGVAMALRDVPAANASWAGDKILQYNNVDVSVAVAIDGGLITPIVKNADQKTLSTMSNELKDLIVRARDGKLQPEEYQGGGFSISNLGMFGIKNFNAIINPPQSCILAVGAGEERVIVENGQMKVANMLSVTLSSDHRVVDGAVGAEFLAAFKRYIESPMAMMV